MTEKKVEPTLDFLHDPAQRSSRISSHRTNNLPQSIPINFPAKQQIMPARSGRNLSGPPRFDRDSHTLRLACAQEPRESSNIRTPKTLAVRLFQQPPSPIIKTPLKVGRCCYT